MTEAGRTPVNVFDKAKSQSYSDKDHKTFKKVESRFDRMNKTRLAGKLAAFRRVGREMTVKQRLEDTRSSATLGKHLRVSGVPRPGARWEAHHIVSADHKEAAGARLIIAEDDIAIRLDDPDNGAWMPKTKADARPTLYPNAIGHNRIHRQLYYRWIENAITMMDDGEQVRAFLNTVRAQLLHGHISDEMKLQSEIDEAEYDDWLKKNRKL
ncbi:HNH/ENDO VII superfamily nuclease [Sinobacterium caligoides]|uniref:HNH/ENDO VII superfamily nuclease n=1 Tax=Sinobacterium caligoides TaxID=933926 RepID=A0A3N2E0Y9_9GAMM|nr:AHH domain-containing protein [Sinobacterium caligoides]ROS05697.1 HNH/ENDO VII superfamily nuclease [Sinobacterium caligoides]